MQTKLKINKKPALIARWSQSENHQTLNFWGLALEPPCSRWTLLLLARDDLLVSAGAVHACSGAAGTRSVLLGSARGGQGQTRH